MISRLFSKMFGLFRNVIYYITGRVSKTENILDKNKVVVKEKFESVIEEKKNILSRLREAFNKASVQTLRHERDLESQCQELENATKIAEKALTNCSKYVNEHSNDSNLAVSEVYTNYKAVYEKALIVKKEKTELIDKYRKLHAASVAQENNIKSKMSDLKRNIDSLVLKKDSLLKNIELKESIDAMSTEQEHGNLSYLEAEEKKLQDLALEMEVFIKNHDQESNSSLQALEKQLLEDANKDAIFDEFDKMVGLVKQDNKVHNIENVTSLSSLKSNEIFVEVMKE